MPQHGVTEPAGVWQRRLWAPVGVTPLDLLHHLVLLLLEAPHVNSFTINITSVALWYHLELDVSLNLTSA